MLADELFAEIQRMPVIDVHSHINRDEIAAPSLDAVMFYHMQMYPLRSAGATEGKMWPEQLSKRVGLPYDEWFKYWPMTEHTGFGCMLKVILKDLYDFDGPFKMSELPRLRKQFEQRVSQKDWPQQVWRKCNLTRIFSSHLKVRPLEKGQWDAGIRFTIESFPTNGTHEYHGWKRRLTYMSKFGGKDITSRQRLYEAAGAYYDTFDWSDKHGLVSWMSGLADFTPVSDATLDRMLSDTLAGKKLSPEDSRLLEGQYIRSLCQAIRGRVSVYQLCYGVQYLTPRPKYAHPVYRAAQTFAGTFGHLLGEFPDIHFNMLNGFEADEPVWAGLTQAYGNFSLANVWWECFYPSVIENAISRRLDMVPLSRLIGFFSDGWCADYVYGRLRMVQKAWAWALARKIEQGYYSTDQALKIARHCFFDTGKAIFLPGETVS
jgi:hypothetical protein